MATFSRRRSAFNWARILATFTVESLLDHPDFPLRSDGTNEPGGFVPNSEQRRSPVLNPILLGAFQIYPRPADGAG